MLLFFLCQKKLQLQSIIKNKKYYIVLMNQQITGQIQCNLMRFELETTKFHDLLLITKSNLKPHWLLGYCLLVLNLLILTLYDVKMKQNIEGL